MQHPTHFTLTLPAPLSNPDSSRIVESSGSVVIIGANGSGKSRLGTWIELNSLHSQRAHRVAAQKSLRMPSNVRSSSIEIAEKDLRYGYEQATYHDRIGHRWGHNPYTALLDDYDRLMVYLFTEEADKSIAYRKAANRGTPPQTKLDIIQSIWERILPHRQLVIGAGKVEAKVRSKDGPV